MHQAFSLDSRTCVHENFAVHNRIFASFSSWSKTTDSGAFADGNSLDSSFKAEKDFTKKRKLKQARGRLGPLPIVPPG
jgi:hypothetical protein